LKNHSIIQASKNLITRQNNSEYAHGVLLSLVSVQIHSEVDMKSELIASALFARYLIDNEEIVPNVRIASAIQIVNAVFQKYT